MRYLQRCRLQYAKALLADGKLSIAEIAAAAGFCDQSHLSRSFRKFAGMTPRQFAHASDDGECVKGARCVERMLA